MRTQIASIDIHFILKEFKDLLNCRVDKVFNKEKEDIYIQFYKSNVGKKILRIIVGNAIFLTDTKNVDEMPSGFCMLLRKYLEGKYLESITQIKPERILELIFKSKDETKKLYIELFAKGNVILCGDDGIIIDSILHHKFRERYIFPKQNYKHPIMDYNVFNLTNSQLSSLLINSKKDKVVTSLATDLGLGGIYSEEICLLSKIEKNIKPDKITNNEINDIMKSINKLINKKIIPQIIYKDKEAIDFTPMDLEFYKGYEGKKFSSFSKALEEYFTREINFTKKEETAYTKKIDELDRIITEQKDTLNELKKKLEENKEKGEMIYNNYQLINEISDEMNKASKKYSWKDIKEKLKGHKIIKDVDVKEKKITIEINK